MTKIKLTKIDIQSYFDNELSENENQVVKDFLIDSPKGSQLLSRLHKLDEIVEDEEIGFDLYLENKIKNNAYELLKERRNRLEKNKSKMQGSFFDEFWSMTYTKESMALYSLIIVLGTSMIPEDINQDFNGFERESITFINDNNQEGISEED